MDTLYNIGFISEFMAAISATVFFYKYKHTKLVWLLPLLWYIPINEILCQKVFGPSTTGYILYNIYRIIVPLSLLLIISSQLKGKNSKSFTLVVILLFTVGVVLDFAFTSFTTEFLNHSLTFSSILIVVMLLRYFVEELKSDNVLMLKKNLFLWVSFGFLTFHIAYPVIVLAEQYLINGNNTLRKSLFQIHLVIIIISYLFIAFAFYWSNKIPHSNTHLLKKDD
ncbi:hypothetical protein [uncultured Dokdonia sp.]|uniref:hypothetical protein n=1 Tax=uncultured Dokdonia sp. TaxID=575653 RepID=UPI0026090A92|nr:hypothetical protein [uncultured Dokdonia sp.]